MLRDEAPYGADHAARGRGVEAQNLEALAEGGCVRRRPGPFKPADREAVGFDGEDAREALATELEANRELRVSQLFSRSLAATGRACVPLLLRLRD